MLAFTIVFHCAIGAACLANIPPQLTADAKATVFAYPSPMYPSISMALRGCEMYLNSVQARLHDKAVQVSCQPSRSP